MSLEQQQQNSFPSWVDLERVPELRLFVSFDIEGSTHFKHHASRGSHTWGPFFRTFFERFPSVLGSCEKNIIRDYSSDVERSTFEIWKTLGDEIIFQKPLIGGLDAFIGTLAAKQALIRGATLLNESAKNRQDSSDDTEKVRFPSQLKATAWIAGFPNKNIKITNSHTNITDFIGPSIDLGFRIAKHSTSSRMPISLSLAWMLSTIITDPKVRTQLNQRNLDLCYHGRESLKGIDKNDENYPIFYINTSDSISVYPEQERVLTSTTYADPNHIKNFCTDTKTFMGRPFILNDVDKLFDFPAGEESSQYINHYKALSLPQPPENIVTNEVVAKTSSTLQPDDVEQKLHKALNDYYENK